MLPRHTTRPVPSTSGPSPRAFLRRTSDFFFCGELVVNAWTFKLPARNNCYAQIFSSALTVKGKLISLFWLENHVFIAEGHLLRGDPFENFIFNGESLILLQPRMLTRKCENSENNFQTLFSQNYSFLVFSLSLMVSDRCWCLWKSNRRVMRDTTLHWQVLITGRFCQVTVDSGLKCWPRNLGRKLLPTHDRLDSWAGDRSEMNQ